MVVVFSLTVLAGYQNPLQSTQVAGCLEEKNQQVSSGLLVYERVVPNADCGTTDNVFIYLENDTVELAVGVPVWTLGPGGYQPLAWALVFSNWGSNMGTAYFIYNGYVHSSFIPC